MAACLKKRSKRIKLPKGIKEINLSGKYTMTTYEKKIFNTKFEK